MEQSLKESNQEIALGTLEQGNPSNNSSSRIANETNLLINQKHQPIIQNVTNPKIQQLIQRTGYTMDITPRQRKYGGPPPDWEGPAPVDCQVYVGKIPYDIFEDELVPLFETCGKIYDLRLMVDPASGQNRGYAFLTYTTKEAAKLCIDQYHGYQIRSYKPLTVSYSRPNVRLFISPIPKNKSKEEIYQELNKLTDGLADVTVYPEPDSKDKIRGFAFLNYIDHKTAACARRKLITNIVSIWGKVLNVEWAEALKEPDDDVMAKVKEVYCSNIAQDTTEEILKGVFSKYGTVKYVKKIRDYAFIGFDTRDSALKSIENLDNTVINGCNVNVQLAKPPGRKEKPVKMAPVRKPDQNNPFSGNIGKPTPLMASLPYHRHTIVSDYSKNNSISVKDEYCDDKNYASNGSEAYDPSHPTDSEHEYGIDEGARLDDSNCNIRKMPPDLLASQTLEYRDKYNSSYHSNGMQTRTNHVLEYCTNSTNPRTSKQPVPLISLQVPTNGRKRALEESHEYNNSQPIKKRTSSNCRQPPLLMEMTKGPSYYRDNDANHFCDQRFSPRNQDPIADVFSTNRTSPNSSTRKRNGNDNRKPQSIMQQLRKTDHADCKTSRNIVSLFDTLPLY